MYTKHHNPSCDGLHFATFMFLLVHRLCGCQRKFLCTRFKVEVVDAKEYRYGGYRNSIKVTFQSEYPEFFLLTNIY